MRIIAVWLLSLAPPILLAETPLRPVPVSPPGSTSASIPLTEFQMLKFENISLRADRAMLPFINENADLLRAICDELGLIRQTCKVDLQSRMVTGIPQRAEPSEPEAKAGSQKKKKSKKAKESS